MEQAPADEQHTLRGENHWHAPHTVPHTFSSCSRPTLRPARLDSGTPANAPSGSFPSEGSYTGTAAFTWVISTPAGDGSAIVAVSQTTGRGVQGDDDTGPPPNTPPVTEHCAHKSFTKNLTKIRTDRCRKPGEKKRAQMDNKRKATCLRIPACPFRTWVGRGGQLGSVSVCCPFSTVYAVLFRKFLGLLCSAESAAFISPGGVCQTQCAHSVARLCCRCAVRGSCSRGRIFDILSGLCAGFGAEKVATDDKRQCTFDSAKILGNLLR